MSAEDTREINMSLINRDLAHDYHFDELRLIESLFENANIVKIAQIPQTTIVMQLGCSIDPKIVINRRFSRFFIEFHDLPPIFSINGRK